MVTKAFPRTKRTAPRKARLPRIEFRYSWVYDHENKLRYTDPLYPSGDNIRDYIEEVSQNWKSRQRTILNSITRTSGLPWQEDLILCYLVGRGLPLSDPLTMPLYEGQPETFLEKMTYQLVERMVMHPRNLKSQSGFWEAMFRSMSEDGVKVSYMVPVNAIFRELQSRYFQTQDPSKSLLTKNMDFRRSWEIVDSLGHSTIIERFRRGVWD
jgi:hypothetical protein